MSYRIDEILTKTSDQEWSMMPITKNTNSVSTFTVDERDSTIISIDDVDLLERILRPEKHKRTPRDKFTWDRSWIDSNTLLRHYYFETLEDLHGFYLDMTEYNPVINPGPKPLSAYNIAWKAYDSDNNEVALP